MLRDARTQDAGGTVQAATAEIVAAYVANNSADPGQLSRLIRSVGAAVAAAEAGAGGPSARNRADAPVPAVPASRSVGEHSVVCLECGRRMQQLARHLRAVHGLSETDYKRRFQLPDDHPMNSRRISRERAARAKRIGLGRRPDRAR